MKIGIFGDLHIHSYKRFGLNPVSGLSRRLDDQVCILNQMLDIFKNVKYVIGGGDILHKSSEIPTECINILRHFFYQLDLFGIKTFMVTGNHDLVVLDNPIWYNITTNFFNVNNDMSFINDNNIKLINYNDVVDYNVIKGYNLVILHKMPIGSKQNGYTFEDGIDWKTLSQNNKLVLFAHNHERQKLSDNCYVLGDVMHLDFGDTGERGVYIFDTELGNLEFIKLKYPEFITVNAVNDIKMDGNYYRLKGVKTKLDNTNVITEVDPVFFDERIKSDNFELILDEWIRLNNKEPKIIESVRKILSTRVNSICNIFKGTVVKIEGFNFLSYEKFDVDISKGFIIIKGSNGAGKSTIVGEALCWGLTGETTKGLTGDDVIRNRPIKQKNCEIKITLKDADVTITIIRSRKDGLVVLYKVKDGDVVNVTEGLRQLDRQKKLEELVGFNKDVFLSSCYFSQEGLVTLTGLSDTEKTDMITNLLGFDQYSDLYDKVFNEQKLLSSNIEIIRNEIQNIDFNIIRLEDRKKSINIDIELANKMEMDSNSKILDLNNDILDLNKSKEFMRCRINSNSVELKEHTKDIKDIQEKEESVSIDLKILEKNIIKIKEDRDALMLKCNTATSEVKSIEKEIKVLELEQFNISHLLVGVQCDKCKSVITNEHKETHINDLNDRLKNKKEELLVFNNEYNNILNLFNNKNTECDNVNKEILKYRQILNLLINERIKFIEEDKIRESMEFEYLTEERTIDNKIHNKELEIKFQSEHIEKVRDGIIDKRKELDTLRLKIESEINSKLLKNNDILQLTDTINNLDFWKMSFSSKGIRSVLLDRFCNQFNKIVVEYISNISNGNIQVVLTPTKLTKGGEERNKIGLDIVVDGCSSTYNGLSGGEKARVNTALCLSLNKWISTKYGLLNGLLGIIVLDELFGSVDPEGEEALARQIIEESKNKTVFVISHTVELGSWADKVWNVYKEHYISKLKICN